MKLKTTYLIWKNPSCNGVNPQWTQLSRAEFLALVKSPEAKGRFFERLESSETDGSDGKLVMECTESRYIAYRKEKRHKQYLNDSNPGYSVVSYHAFINDDANHCGEDVLCDNSCDVEAEALKNYGREELKAAISRLSASEQEIINYFWLSDVKGTERDFANLTGASKSSVNRRKKAVLATLRKFLLE